MGSYVAKPKDITNAWLLLDGTDQVLGRMASRIATVLMGKHKPTYTPHIDTGDHVVVVNAAKVRISPEQKPRTRMITYHTGWIGGLKQTPVTEAFEKNPDRVIRLAVRRMLPKSKLGKQMLTKLKIYPGEEHPHSAQKPQPFPGTV
ncbi:MAG: 50S ribosomal protein L13 [Planctomycetota bacterium JB042]